MKIKIKNPFNKMKKMSPKDLFSKKNIITTLITCVATAGIIAGSLILISHASPASAINGAITYTASNSNAGNVTVLTMGLNGDLTATNSIQCPAVPSVPVDGVCYGTGSVTASSGITGNVTAVLREPGMTSALRIYYSVANAISNLEAASITLNGFGDLVGPVTGTSFQNPPPPPNPTAINGGAIINNADQINGNLATITFNFNNAANDTDKVACPQGIGDQNTVCYTLASVTNLSGTGVAAGVDAADVTAVIKFKTLPNQGAQPDNTIIVFLNQANAITDPSLGASITVNNLSGVRTPIVAPISFPAPANPTAVNGSLTYMATSAMNGGNSLLVGNLNGALTDANKVACNGVAGTDVNSICYAGNNATLTGTGVVQGTTVTMIIKSKSIPGSSADSDQKILFLLSGANAMTTLEGTLTFGGFSNIPAGSITTTAFQNPPPANPNSILQANYIATDNAINGGFSTITINFNSPANDTDKVACPGGVGNESTICYPLTSITDISGTGAVGTSASDVTAVVKLNTLPDQGGQSGNNIVVFLGKANAITDVNQGANITVNNLSGIRTPLVRNIQFPPAANPNSITGAAIYTAADPTNNNLSTITFNFNSAANTSSGTGSCGAIGNQNTACYGPAGITNLSGTGVAGGISASNVTAIVKINTLPGKEGKTDSQIIVFLDQANAITDVNQGVTMTVNNFSGISSPITVNSFQLSAGANPSKLAGDIKLSNQNPIINNYKGSMVVPFDQNLNNKSGTGSCQSGLGIPAGATCYNPSGVTALTGTGLTNGVTKSNIVALVKASAYQQFQGQDNVLVVLFDVPNIASNPSNLTGISITFADFSNIASPITGTSFKDESTIWHIATGETVYIQSQQPVAGSSVNSSINQLQVKFSGPIDMSAVTNSNVSVQNGTGTIGTSFAFDQTTFALTISLSQTPVTGVLALNLNNLKAANGTSIPNSHFEWTVTSGSATNPQVIAASPSNNSTGVSPVISDIIIRFDQPLASPLNTTNGITISPSIAISTPYFDPTDNTLHIQPKASLTASTQYQVTLSPTADANGNTLKGLYGNAISGYTDTFTTGTLDNTAPRLTWASFKTSEVWIGYNTTLKTSATTTANWGITCGGSPVSLTQATVSNTTSGYLEIKGLTLTAGANCTATLSNVTGLNDTAFGGTDNVISGTVISTTSYTMGEGANWGYGMCMTGATCDSSTRRFDPMVMQWSPIKFDPNIKVQGTEANETLVGFPTSKALTSGDKIVITLPTGSSINAGTLGTIGTDINKSDGATLSNVYYANAKVTISSLTYDQTSNKLTGTLSIDTNGDGAPNAGSILNPSGYLEFIVKGFINGSASTYDPSQNTGGASATYSTVSGTTGQPTEAIGQSTPYTVAAAGSGSISGSVTKSVGGTGIQNVKVIAEGSNGKMSTTTDSSGNYTISNLTNGNYFVFIDPTTTIGNYVVSSNQNYTTLADGSNTKTGINFKLDEGTKTINVTIQSGSISNGTLKGMLEAFNYSKNQHIGKEVTLDADGTTASTLAVTTGEWEISFGFYNEATTSTYANNNASDFGYMPSQGQIVNVTDASGAQSVTLSLASTDATINVTVLDGSNTAVSGATVYAYRPDGTIGGTQATTDATGTCALKLKNGTYTVGAMMTGTPGTQEKSVTVAANGTASATFQINVPSIIMSGTITGPNKEAWVNAYNQTSGYSATAKSDKETGIYSLRVNANRTYTVTASNPNGQNSATGAYASGNQNTVPIVSSNISSVDFVNTASNFGTISGTLTPAESGARVCAELYNTTTKNTIKAGGCSVTNDSGAFTITTSRNAVSGERYRLSAYSMTYGALPSIDNIDISSTDATNKNISAGTTYQVTLNITGIPSTAGSVFFNMINTSTGKGTNFEIKSITNGTATKTFSSQQGTYNTTLSIPGLGEIAPDTGKSVSLTSNQTLNFTVGNMNADVKTLNVTVTNGSGTAVQGAIVTADDFTAGTSANGSTDAEGKVTLKIKVTTSVTIRADSTLLSSAKTTFKKSDLSNTNNVSIELGSQKSSTVTFNVTGTPNSVWVDLTSADGSFWNGTSLNSAGAATINVPANLTNATAYLHAQTGESKTITNITAGQTISTTFASFSAPAAWLSTFLDNTPVSSPFNPNTGMSLDDSLNTGVNLEIGAGAFGTDSDQYSASVSTVANTPNNSSLPTRSLAVGKEVKFTNADGNIVTDITGEYEISIFLFKAEVEAAKGIVFDNYNDILNAQLGYWDSAMNSYVSELTTKTAYVQETAGSAWTIVDLSTLIAKITINPDYYFDYKIEFKSIVNHATIFSTIVGSDGTPPSAPTGLSGREASTTSATLTWNANSEPDLMEYEIYRSTSPSVTISDLNQVNTSPITTNSFTDGIATPGTYYYIVTAVDDSGNESIASSESSVVISASTQVTAGNTIQGSSSTPSHDDTDEDTGTGDIDESTDDDSGITLDEGTEEESDEGEENVGTDENTSTEETDYASHWAESYIEKILAAGIAEGVSSTQFEPDRELTRAEMTKMVLNAFDYDVGPVESSTFSDVDVDEWYAPYIEKAYTEGIVIGYSNGTFKPDNLVNRAEAMKIIVNTYAIVNDLTLTANSLPFSDVISDAWYTKYISYGYYKGIVGGYSDGTFKPENAVTRAEFSKMTVLLLDL